MRVFKHPKLKHLASKSQKFARVTEVTGVFRPEEWTAKDRNILRRLMKEHFREEARNTS